MRGRSAGRGSMVVALGAMVALLSAGAALASVPALRTHSKHHGLSAHRVARDAKGVTKRVIVVLRNQHNAHPASARSLRARAALERRERKPLIARITRAGGRVTSQYRTLNAFAATMSRAESTAIAADPAVSRVVPDAVVRQPRPAVGTAAPAAAPGTGPRSQLCTEDPSKPLLEPEALQTTNTAFPDPSTPQAQSLATGKGVKVAFFADGLDIDNPDFIRADGSHVFIDYRDFSGDGPNAVTGGAEAFGDASSIAAQGRTVYDVADYVNPAHAIPKGCTITVRGFAPGASLIGMKVFGNVGAAYASVIIQGMDWAVSVDHADVISESFGGYPIPSTTADLIKAFNDQAVAAGVTVSQGSGDSGATASPSSPGDDPLVIDVGASTNFRAYAQTASYGFQFSNGTYLSDNISSIGGGGFTQDGNTVDLVAPGEADWALCSPNVAMYTECTSFNDDKGSGLQQFGGTSQATPMTAGAAALIIEAYRDTHGGRTPAPALVKRILTSTANDLALPSEEQGAGELDALEAVLVARSIDGGTAAGHGLLVGTGQLQLTGRAGSTPAASTVPVTNASSATRTVQASVRALTTQLSAANATVNLGTSPTFVDQFGTAVPYAKTTFSVPAGADRLLVEDAWAGPNARVAVALIDPSGAYAAFTRPQGNGNHGQVDVRKPAAGTWTAIVFLRDGTFSGPVQLGFTTQRFGSTDAVYPSSLTLAPGQTGRFRVRPTLPQSAGDSSRDLVISDDGGEQTVVPIVLRSLIDVDRQGGNFTGTVTGGNGRPGPAEVQTYAFDVPRGRPAVSASLSFTGADGSEVQGYLIDPGGNALAAQSTTTIGNAAGATATPGHALKATHLDPQPGRWRFIAVVTSPVAGTTLATPFQGRIDFGGPAVRVTGLPHSRHTVLAAGKPVTATIRVRNDGPAPEDLFADPRLRSYENLTVIPLTPATGLTLPIPGDRNPPLFLLPGQTRAVVAAAEASAPITLELGHATFGEGDPDVGGISVGTRAVAAYAAPEVSAGLWLVAPALRGPFTEPATGTADTGLAINTRGFDTAVSSSTGDVNRQFVDPDAPDYTPLTLAPGATGTITVTITPSGRRGSVVKGDLFLNDFSNWLGFTNEHAAIPYRYRVG